MSFFESLSPIVGYFPRNDTWADIMFRIAIFTFIVSISVYFYYFPEVIIYLYNLTMGYCNDVFQWGNTKLTNYHVNFKTKYSMETIHLE